MKELELFLNNVSDTYYDFVTGILHYAQKKQSRLDAVLRYIKDNPNATSSDIVYFVSIQPDFYEDAARQNVPVDNAV
ncbi:MAG: hypothetical protein IJ224_06620 [Lachnospiraceae bacterium]|nr:hypothetical protein [Lachnospiraceae bacterium]